MPDEPAKGVEVQYPISEAQLKLLIELSYRYDEPLALLINRAIQEYIDKEQAQCRQRQK